jgi:integrase
MVSEITGREQSRGHDGDQARRANADGSIFFWEGRGWYAAITDTSGRRIQRKAPRQTKGGAEKLLRELLAQRDRGELTKGTKTLSQFKEEWLEAARLRGCRPRTLESYREKIEKHVEPTLGRLQLAKITAENLDKLYADRQKAGASPTSVGMIHATLFNLLKLAKRRRYVAVNVAEHVDPPKATKYAARTMSIEECQNLLTAARDQRHGALWTFMLGTGCRFGEAAGLTWENLDMDDGIAHIRQQVTRERSDGKVRYVLSPTTKSDAGQRDLPLPTWVMAALRSQRSRVVEMRLAAGPAWDDNDLVFPTDAGRPLQENHVLVVWHRVLKEIGIEGEGKRPVRMHDLRHTKGTLMIDEGEELVVVQRTLGHARQSITADLYVGKVPKALRKAADRFGELLMPSSSVTHGS